MNVFDCLIRSKIKEYKIRSKVNFVVIALTVLYFFILMQQA